MLGYQHPRRLADNMKEAPHSAETLSGEDESFPNPQPAGSFVGAQAHSAKFREFSKPFRPPILGPAGLRQRQLSHGNPAAVVELRQRPHFTCRLGCNILPGSIGRRNNVGWGRFPSIRIAFANRGVI